MSKLDQMSELEKKELLDEFLEAPLEKSFGQEAVALFLNCSTHTLQAMRCNGSSLPYSKVGRCVAYQKSDVLAYQASKKVFNTAQLARAS